MNRIKEVLEEMYLEETFPYKHIIIDEGQDFGVIDLVAHPEKEDEAIRKLGYVPYRIFTSAYFANEELEQQELNAFIVKASKLIPEPKVKKNTVLLMDHLFQLFKDPHLVYYQLDKALPIKEIVKEMIKECAPISIEELELVVKENTREIVKKLEHRKEIVIEDGFIYLPKQKVQFRRVDRDEEYYRPLKYVSNKEYEEANSTVLELINLLEERNYKCKKHI